MKSTDTCKTLFEVTVYFSPKTVLLEADDAAQAVEQATDGLTDIEDIQVELKEKDEDACERHYLWNKDCPDCTRQLHKRVEDVQ